MNGWILREIPLHCRNNLFDFNVRIQFCFWPAVWPCTEGFFKNNKALDWLFGPINKPFYGFLSVSLLISFIILNHYTTQKSEIFISQNEYQYFIFDLSVQPPISVKSVTSARDRTRFRGCSIRRVIKVRIAIDSKKSQIFQCVTALAHGHLAGPQKPTDIRIEHSADPCPSVLPFQWQKVCILFSDATSKITINVHVQSHCDSHKHWRLQYACTSATQRLPWLGR